MTTYEILLLLDPERAEARQDDVVARTRELVERNGGAWHSHDAWGRRRLAYPIAHKEEGVYHLVVFDAESDTLEEISRVLKIEDAVLRHLATRHIAGSRTSAPRDEAAAPAAAGSVAGEAGDARPENLGASSETAEPEAAVSEDGEAEYAGAEDEPGEEEE
ncbi:MAG TPA: 30S ribosomal protein S6 [Gaiellaceae bacterium]|nr:30S ribosomal protein S6 [Gaiellaceae bacterium]